jgi:uncharacterized membrane protein
MTIEATQAAAPPAPAGALIRWHYLWYVGGALTVMVAAIRSHDLWFLNYVHVFCGVLWTGIDLFMGFVLGPIMRTLDINTRKAVTLRLTPRTLFLLPTLAIITGTTGWYLAVERGFTQLDWPEYGWVAAALALVTLMTVQGIGFLLPTNLRICLELQKKDPDLTKIGRWMPRYFYVTALQGTMQILIIIIMARFVTGI